MIYENADIAHSWGDVSVRGHHIINFQDTLSCEAYPVMLLGEMKMPICPAGSPLSSHPAQS